MSARARRDRVAGAPRHRERRPRQALTLGVVEGVEALERQEGQEPGAHRAVALGQAVERHAQELHELRVLADLRRVHEAHAQQRLGRELRLAGGLGVARGGQQDLAGARDRRRGAAPGRARRRWRCPRRGRPPGRGRAPGARLVVVGRQPEGQAGHRLVARGAGPAPGVRRVAERAAWPKCQASSAGGARRGRPASSRSSRAAHPPAGPEVLGQRLDHEGVGEGQTSRGAGTGLQQPRVRAAVHALERRVAVAR